MIQTPLNKYANIICYHQWYICLFNSKCLPLSPFIQIGEKGKITQMPYHTHMQDRECTDSISCPMLITWGAEGDRGIFGINRERSETDASLIVSSSPPAEFEGKSCIIMGKKKTDCVIFISPPQKKKCKPRTLAVCSPGKRQAIKPMISSHGQWHLWDTQLQCLSRQIKLFYMHTHT